MFYCLGPALSFVKASGQFEAICLASIFWCINVPYLVYACVYTFMYMNNIFKE